MSRADNKPTTDSFLSKEDSTLLKGASILLMLAHHLWAFPERLPSPVRGMLFFLGDGYFARAADFGKICVALFSFLGGYGYYIKYNKKKVSTISDIKKLYCKFWEVFFIFIPIGFLFFSNQSPYSQYESTYTHYSTFSIKEFVLNVLCLVPSYNNEWWFLGTYVICLLAFPLIRWMVDKIPIVVNVVFMLFLQQVFYQIDILRPYESGSIYENVMGGKFPYIVCFFMGALVAGKGLYTKSFAFLNKLKGKVIWCSFMLAAIFVLREVVDNIACEFAFTLLLIPALAIILREFKYVRKGVSFMGKHSTNMWLTHTFFCYYFGVFAKSVVFFKWSIPCLLVLIAYAIATSLLLDWFWGGVSRAYRYISRADRES